MSVSKIKAVEVDQKAEASQVKAMISQVQVIAREIMKRNQNQNDQLQEVKVICEVNKNQ